MDDSFDSAPATRSLIKPIWAVNWLPHLRPRSVQHSLAPDAPAALRPVARARMQVDESDAAHLLCAQLRLRWFNAPNRRMLSIASVDPREPDDPIASRVVLASAHAGQKTLLVDADIRTTAPSGLLARDRTSAGLCSLLERRASPTEAIVPGSVPGLWLLPAGTPGQSPEKLFANGDLKQVLQEAAKGFDMVLIVTPRIGAYADSLVISEAVGGALFTVQRNHTSASRLKEAASQLRSMDVTIVGAVFTDI
jgi:capsular exopolysaccharide synthesis family protein